MSKALDGVRILDLGHVQAAPTATQLLAWMGAEVIKVEMPGRGDITRGQLRDVKGADSLYFTMLNSNKRSITINLKSAGGKKVLEELVRRCDVVVENFGPGVLDRQGFTWARFQELNPRIIYASIKGFGPGRFADFKAYENVAQCMGGASSTTGWEDGPPTVTGAQIGDSGTGVHLVAGILAALFQREKTGKGQRVQVAMTDAVLNLCRVKMRDQQRLEHWTLTKTTSDVMAALNEADIPCGPILSMKDIYEDKELYERGYLVELDHPTRGRYVQVGMPIQLSDSPPDIQRSPLLGEHTEEV